MTASLGKLPVSAVWMCGSSEVMAPEDMAASASYGYIACHFAPETACPENETDSPPSAAVNLRFCPAASNTLMQSPLSHSDLTPSEICAFEVRPSTRHSNVMSWSSSFGASTVALLQLTAAMAERAKIMWIFLFILFRHEKYLHRIQITLVVF